MKRLSKICAFSTTILLLLKVNACSNIDTKHPITFNGDIGSYFGFKVQLHNSGTEKTILVGAPKGEPPIPAGVKKQGSLLECSIGSRSCVHVEVEATGNDHQTPGKTITKDLKDNMMLGWSVDAQEQEPHNVVVCAPSWRNKQLHFLYPVNGACYVMDQKLSVGSVKKLTPLIDRAFQSKLPAYKEYYSFGQAGFSAEFHKFSDSLILGAPGLANWTGNVIAIEESNGFSPPQVPNLPKELSNKEALYLGYSVTTGQFFLEGESCMAAGAPRDADLKGKVYVLKMWSQNNKTRMNVTTSQEGQQMGEYFGYAILGVDTNADRLTDLMVGAPFFSAAKSQGENGRVYQYFGSATGLLQGCSLTGSNAEGGRFGSSLSDLGDLNQDGFNDVAVGAPYEDQQGAVYIFHGSSDGLKCNYVQKIHAQEVNFKGPGFGFSISRGLDVDNNNFADIAIGSYGEDSVILLRSHPVINVKAVMTSSVKSIDLKSTNCVPRKDGSGDPCFVLSLCLTYSGSNAPSKINISVTLGVDNYFQSVFKFPRGFFIEATEVSPVFQFVQYFELVQQMETCRDFNVFILKDNGTFYIDPLSLIAQYGVAESSDTSKFCELCPVISGQGPHFVELQVPFAVGCGTDNVCQSDLSIDAKVTQLRDKQELIIGVNTQINLEVIVRNQGEPAYAPVVNVTIPRDLSIVNLGPCTEGETGPQSFQLLCGLANPLKSDQTVSFEIKLDASRIRSEEIQLVSVEVTTVSQEQSPDNDRVVVKIPFKKILRLQLIGIPNPSTIVYNENTEKTVPFQHQYEIFSQYTPVEEITLEISIPGLGDELDKMGLRVVNLTWVEVSGPISCNDWNPGEIVDFEPAALKSEKQPKERDFTLDCVSTKCEKIWCSGGPIKRDNSAKVIVRGYVDISVARDRAKNKYLDMVYFITSGDVYVRDGTVIHEHSEANAQVKTTMTKEGFPAVEPIPMWIIVASVVGGVLILVLIVILLVHFGFFRRHKQEEMAELKQNEKLLDDSGRATTS